VIAIDDQDRVKLSRKALLREQRGDGGHPREGPPGPHRSPPRSPGYSGPEPGGRDH
jgi:hypothetical protein